MTSSLSSCSAAYGPSSTGPAGKPAGCFTPRLSLPATIVPAFTRKLTDTSRIMMIFSLHIGTEQTNKTSNSSKEKTTRNKQHWLQLHLTIFTRMLPRRHCKPPCKRSKRRLKLIILRDSTSNMGYGLVIALIRTEVISKWSVMASQLRKMKFFPPLTGFEPMSGASSSNSLMTTLRPLSLLSIPLWVNYCCFDCRPSAMARESSSRWTVNADGERTSESKFGDHAFATLDT